MHVVIFEGNHWRQFAPLTLSRPVFQLLCGAGTLLSKQIRATNPTKITLWVRPGLEAYCRQFIVPTLPCPADVNVPLGDERVLLLSGRTLHLTNFEHDESESVVVDETPTGRVVRQAVVRKPGLAPSDLFGRTPRWMELLELPQSFPQSRLPEYIWDLISWNEEAIVTDAFERQQPSEDKPAGHYHMVDHDNIYFGKEVKPAPGVVLDASKGPIILADHVSIGANSVLTGPCYIGHHTKITPLSNIRQGVSIGPMCKIGGEVSNSIVLGYTNKPHEGFLGDSYIGEWVNIGAGACTSNLKNTYTHISMSLGGKPIETGRRFLGAMVGDHTKIAISTQLMTGSYIGFNSMIATAKYPPHFVPSFTYLTDDGAVPYRLDKAVGAMKEVFNRRGREWTETDDLMNQFVVEMAKLVELPEK